MFRYQASHGPELHLRAAASCGPHPTAAAAAISPSSRLLTAPPPPYSASSTRGGRCGCCCGCGCRAARPQALLPGRWAVRVVVSAPLRALPPRSMPYFSTDCLQQRGAAPPSLRSPVSG